MEILGLRGLRNAVVGVFVACLVSGMLLPVYTDEVGWRFQERAAIDGVDKLYTDTCGANTLAVPPFFMMPVRYFSAVMNTTFADPFYVRLSGVGYALLWALLLLVLIRRLVDDVQARRQLSIVGIGLMALGTLPLQLVWSRPEQPIVLALTAALLIAWSDWRNPGAPTPARTAWLRSGAIMLLGVVAVSYHMKGVFLLPLLLACIVLASRGRASIVPRAAMGVLLMGLMAWAVHYWLGRLRCPDDPVLWKIYAAHSVGALLSDVKGLGDVFGAIGRLIGNMSPMTYFDLPAPKLYPMSSWLESGLVSFGEFRAWIIVLRLAWLLTLTMAAIAIYASLRGSLPRRRIDPRAAVAVLLLGTGLIWSATQLIRNVYDSTFVLPIMMLGVVFGLAALWGEDARSGAGLVRKRMTAAIWVMGVLAIASPIAVTSTYGPSLVRAAGERGYLEKQPFSLSIFGYASVRPEILATARLCGIDDPAKANALLIDDLTYFAVMKSRLPQHRLGVLGMWHGKIDDPIAYLKSRGSDGAILGCHILPGDLRARAKRRGAFCCLGPLK